MTHVIAAPCIGVKDASCVDVCPTDCIYSGPDEPQFYIHPSECVDCGLCVDACPVEAIFPLEDVPRKWSRFIGRNYRFFGLETPES